MRKRSDNIVRKMGVLCVATIFVAVSASSTVAGVIHGRFMPNPAPTNIVQQYGDLGTGANPIIFDQTVTDTTKSINAGQIKFDFDTYSRKNNTAGAAPVKGGAALAGGFFMNANVKVKTGFSLQWVQTIIATNTGTSAQALWNLPATGAGEYPDVLPAGTQNSNKANGTNDPFYPFQFLPVTPPAGLTRGMQDFPTRNYAGGAQNWLAELGLVAVSDTANINMNGMLFREVRVIDTFLWGFDFVDSNGNGTIDGLAETVGSPPSAFGAPTSGYLNTLNSFFDGTGGGSANLPGVASGKFKFFNNSNAFVMIPTPSTLALLAMAGIIAVRRRR